METIIISNQKNGINSYQSKRARVTSVIPYVKMHFNEILMIFIIPFSAKTILLQPLFKYLVNERLIPSPTYTSGSSL